MGAALMDIQDTVQRSADCFQAACPLGIAVVDRRMRYIASGDAFGQESHFPGALCLSAAAQRALDSRETIPIDGGGLPAACADCAEAIGCKKLAAIYHPILSDGECVGAVIVSAYEPAQAVRMREKYDQMMLSLEQMTERVTLALRNEAERLRREDSEALLQQALDQLRDGAIVLDGERRLVYLNARSQKLLGINARQWAYLQRIRQVQLSFQRRDGDGTEEYLLVARGEAYRLKCRAIPVGGPGREGYKLLTFSALSSEGTAIPPEGQPSQTFDQLIGRSPSFLAAVEKCRHAAFLTGCVLLVGATGTGKEALARAMHAEGPHRDQRFLRVGNNAEFGELARRIGLTGGEAQVSRPAYAEWVRGCTLYIDEINAFNHYNQDKLFMLAGDSRVGGFHLICATAGDLRPLIAKGEFHENLYYALSRDVIAVPALRERPEDIRLLAEHYLARHNEINRKKLRLSGELLAVMERYSWRGNLHELESFVAHTVECCARAEGEILPSDLPDALSERLRGDRPQSYRLDEAEKQLILRCLNDLGAGARSKADAAKALGIGVATLYRKIRQYGIRENTLFEESPYFEGTSGDDG